MDATDCDVVNLIFILILFLFNIFANKAIYQTGILSNRLRYESTRKQ